METQKRVAAVHDISCFGRCSLTVALPILSAAGIETACLPTAVLSTHTGGIQGYTYRDLTEDMMPIVNHWKSLDLHFDAIYTGYLGSFEQIDLVCTLIDTLSSDDTLVFVDPVMADNGVLYASFSPDFPKGMLKICKKADVIVPNITEAVLLLQGAGYDVEYREGPYEKEYIAELLRMLAEATGVQRIILTGVYYEEGALGAVTYSAKEKAVHFASAQRIDGYYHGTGDVFGSAALSAVLNGKSLAEAAQIAVDFTVGSIARTRAAGTDIRFGVNFEMGLAELAKRTAE